MGKSEIFNKFMEYMVRFASIKSIVALKDGFILTLPLTLVGSAFLLVACFPIAGWGALMSSIRHGFSVTAKNTRLVLKCRKVCQPV